MIWRRLCILLQLPSAVPYRPAHHFRATERGHMQICVMRFLFSVCWKTILGFLSNSVLELGCRFGALVSRRTFRDRSAYALSLSLGTCQTKYARCKELCGDPQSLAGHLQRHLYHYCFTNCFQPVIWQIDTNPNFHL